MRKVIVTDKFINSKLDWDTKRAIINAFYNIEDVLGSPELIFSKYTKVFLKNTLGIWHEDVKDYEQLDTELAHKILNNYNCVRRLFHKKKGNTYCGDDYVYGPTNYKDTIGLCDFLKAHKVEDYFLYFYTLFASTNWGAVWSVRACYTPKAIDLYISWKDKYKVEIEKEKQMNIDELENDKLEKTGEKSSSWVDLIEHIEDRKLRLQNKNQLEICLANPEVYLGFHPLSSNCKQCKFNVECAKNIYLFFQQQSNSTLDILEIRSGKLPLQEAIERLKNQGNEFNFYA